MFPLLFGALSIPELLGLAGAVAATKSLTSTKKVDKKVNLKVIPDDIPVPKAPEIPEEVIDTLIKHLDSNNDSNNSSNNGEETKRDLIRLVEQLMSEDFDLRKMAIDSLVESLKVARTEKEFIAIIVAITKVVNSNSLAKELEASSKLFDSEDPAGI